MADRSTDNGSHERNLPDGRSIFDLITSNNLDAMRSLLTPLTLRDRQLIVYQKIDQKTLLYYACQRGFKGIVKYLLDECGADIEDGYCDSSESVSPMRVAIKKLDFALMTLLMRRGATVDHKIRETACVDYAFTTGYYSLMLILRLYKKRINRSNLVVSKPEGVGYNGLFVFSWISEFAYDIRSSDFLVATAGGHVARMKLLLACGVNKTLKNSEEENALCLAILNDQKNAENFLINYKIYTLKSYALALEMCGAKFIVFQSEKQKGLDCWRKSVRIRRKNCIGFADKNQMRIETDLGIEFQTEEEIDRLQIRNDGNLYLQALLVFLRLLSRFSQILHNAYITVARHQIFKEDLLQPLKILSELYDLPTIPLQGVPSPTCRAIDTIVILFRSHFLSDLEDVTDFLYVFGKLFDFLDASTWEGLLRGAVEFYRIAYGELLEIVLTNIHIMKSYNLSQEKNKWIEISVGRILQRCSYPYPTTLMHRAIQSEFPLPVVSFLLKCSADANCPDALENTPLHLVSLLAKERPSFSSLANLLIKAGGHIDSMNQYGIRPLVSLKTKRVIENPLKFLSLQCLSAQVIYKNGIFVSEETFPKILVRFIRLHSA